MSVETSSKSSATFDYILMPTLHRKSFEKHMQNSAKQHFHVKESSLTNTPRLSENSSTKLTDGAPTSTTSKGTTTMSNNKQCLGFALENPSPVTTGFSPMMPKLKFPRLFKEVNHSTGLTSSKTAPPSLMHKALHAHAFDATSFICKRKIGYMRLLLREKQMNNKVEFEPFRNSLESYVFGEQNDSYGKKEENDMLVILKKYLQDNSLDQLNVDKLLYELGYNCSDCVEDQRIVAENCLKNPLVAQQMIEECSYSYHSHMNDLIEAIFPLLDKC